MEIKVTDIGWTGKYYSDEELLDECWSLPEEAMVKYQNEVLFMCWAPQFFDDDFIKNFKGNKIIVVGESGMGCTYNGDNLSKFGFTLKKIVKIPQWYGSEDVMQFHSKQEFHLFILWKILLKLFYADSLLKKLNL